MLIVLFIRWIIFFSLLKTNYQIYYYTISLGLLIVIFLNCNRLWKFFIIYEISLIPIIIIILGLGLNPYRFPASFYIIIYIILFSLPSLRVLIINFKVINSLNIILSNHLLNVIRIITLIILFLVKVPIYGLHYWLPKAHVEASTLGSIILAGGLLKIGTYGFYKIILWIKLFKLNRFYFIIRSIFINIICIIQTDTKKLVALTSVAHITISLSMLTVLTNSSLIRFYLINLRHTFTSVLIFYIVGSIRSLNQTRIIYLLPCFNYSLIYYIFILVIFNNIGTPPFLSFFREIIIFRHLIIFNYNRLIFIIVLLLFATLYSLNLLFNRKIEQFKNFKFSFYLNIIFILNFSIIFCLILKNY